MAVCLCFEPVVLSDGYLSQLCGAVTAIGSAIDEIMHDSLM